MYLDYYGLQEKPFSLTPDSRFIFLSKNHREAFAHLLYGINSRAGFIALTGEVGSGKTTVLRALLNQLDPAHYRTALIFNPCQSAHELLQNINQEFGIPTQNPGRSGLLDGLNPFLLQENAEGRTVVLAIDEAQNLEPQVLEQIRLISNLETEKDKLIQIILSGQPELSQILSRKDLRQLNQRITVRYHLQSMDFEDAAAYIEHRIRMAGRRSADLFSKSALKRIYRYSKGLPRLINAACDRALLTGYTKNEAVISSRIARAGINDMSKNISSSAKKLRFILIPALVAIIAFFSAGIYFTKSGFFEQYGFLQRFNGSQVKVEEKGTEKKTIIKKQSSKHIAENFAENSEKEQARMAFNALAGSWGMQPISKNISFNGIDSVERAALNRKLHFFWFSGNLGALLRVNYPAMLELNSPGLSGKGFVSLVGIKNGKLLVEPSLGGTKLLSFNELDKHWTGQGFILWKDPHNLLMAISKGPKDRIKRLQALLAEAGVYRKPLTGVYDRDTIRAVKKFQSTKNIEQDGLAGVQTLMFLYNSIDRFDVPRLVGGKK